MKKTILIINFLIFAFFGNSQNYVLQKNIATNIKNIEVDKFGNIYTTSENNTIKKYNSEGTLLYTYSNLNFDDASYIDVSNPLKPLVFYKNIKAIKILDNKLSVINEIDLFEKKLDFVDIIANSKGNNFLVYDKEDNKIKKLDKSFNVLYESESFFNLFQEEVSILKIIEQENDVYILDEKGIKVFDTFLTYKKTISIKDITDFQIFGNKIIYFKDKNVYSYNTITLEYEQMAIPQKENIKKVKLLKNKLLILADTELMLYIY